MKFESLGNRMKRYEETSRFKLTRRVPVILRLDQRAGHTFTRGLEKPHDEVYMKSMQETMQYLCKNIQGCVFGYTQSDEITLVLVDYKEIDTDSFFDYTVQKVSSIGASICTRIFNKRFVENATELYSEKENFATYKRKFWEAEFDCRAFNVPREEVCNCVLWRQQDAERNSIQGLAQSMFSHKELHGLSCNLLQNKMFNEKGVNWNELPTVKKRGTACLKDADGKWVIDTEMPILKGEDRQYVESLIYFE